MLYYWVNKPYEGLKLSVNTYNHGIHSILVFSFLNTHPPIPVYSTISDIILFCNPGTHSSIPILVYPFLSTQPLLIKFPLNVTLTCKSYIKTFPWAVPSAITVGLVGDQATLNKYPLPGSINNNGADYRQIKDI